MNIRIEEANAGPLEVQAPPRRLWGAMWRGAQQLCPNCGRGKLFARYLKVRDTCDTCREELHHHRADDAPPYFTIFIAGHLILGGVLSVEQTFHPEPWVQAVVWLPLTLALCLWLLPRIKGSLVALQWALRMHGFSGEDEADHALTGDGPGQGLPPIAAAPQSGPTPTDLR